MKERLRALAPYVGFPIFYFVCLFVFALWTFPYEKLRDQIVAGANKGATYELKIDELGPSWLGVAVKGVHVLFPATEPGKPPTEMKIDDATAHFSIFDIFGGRDLTVRADAFGGSAKVDWDESAKERKIDATLENIDLSQIPLIAQTLGFPVEGALTGSVKATMPDLRMSKMVGSVSLEADSFSAFDGKAKVQGLIAPPKIVLGTLTLNGDVKDGVFKLSKLNAGGKDLELQGDGRIQLREQLMESFCDVNLRVKINDTLRGKNDTTKALLGEPGSTGPSTLELTVPQVKQAKRPDGFYGLHVHGLLSHPGIDPAPIAPPPGGSGSGILSPGALNPGAGRGPG